ncbi:MAG TPA: FAD-binding oxidoreductase [Myxococcota bacterium]|nr:FAD-binding oxidoreductase [Myxococcota bacterium]
MSAAESARVDALQALAREVGAGLESLRHEPVSIDGIAVSTTLRPRDGDALARTVRALGQQGLAAVPLGGGRHLELGNAPRRVDALLCTSHLAAVEDFEPAEGVCHAGAGTRLGALRERIAPAGWELPLDAPDDATLGGALAAGAVGPRTQGYGAPRDVVLGLEVVLGSGERTRCGGRVVKNVTGYDLPKLYTGSCGTLGVIEGAWLRLRPRPACTRVLGLPERAAADALARGVAAARLQSARACALRGRAGEALSGVVELAGAEESVERDARWLAREQGASDADAQAPLRVRAEQLATAAPHGVRFRIPALPTQLAGVLDALDPQAQVIVYPGLCLCYASFPLASPDDAAGAERAFASVAAAARAALGTFRCESAPPDAKRGREVFGPLGGEAALARALKSRFDPHGVLSPGRFAGGA